MYFMKIDDQLVNQVKTKYLGCSLKKESSSHLSRKRMDSFDLSSVVTTKQLLQVNDPVSVITESARASDDAMGKFVQPAAIVQSHVPVTTANINKDTANSTRWNDSTDETVELKRQILNLKMQSDALRKNNMTLASDITTVHHQLHGKDAEIRALQSLLNQKNDSIDDVSHSLEELQILSEKNITELEDKLTESATTLRYLKQCFLKFVSSGDASEKRRLVPVIATILQMDVEEKGLLEHSVAPSPPQIVDGKAILSFWNDLGK